ncbi:telomere length regulation protein TEL2 homolog [Anabrus simplex]|uniref:telomere length regulation protein TEL2 homolog n=1 Tax=Anabrus simplex TaxID=316456 RepID=UPI0035A3D423
MAASSQADLLTSDDTVREILMNDETDCSVFEDSDEDDVGGISGNNSSGKDLNEIPQPGLYHLAAIKRLQQPGEEATVKDITSFIITFNMDEHPFSLQTLTAVLEQLVEKLPGPLTPQKFVGIDSGFLDSCATFPELHYSLVLEALLKMYTSQWDAFNLKHLVTKVFVVPGGGFVMFQESLIVLTQALKEVQRPCAKLDLVVSLLESLVKSEALTGAILDQCRVVKEGTTYTKMMIESQQYKWNEMVQVLISLPSRIANILQHKTSLVFVPNFYAKILCCHIAQCIHFLADAVANREPFNIKPLAALFSKTFICFNEGRRSTSLLRVLSLFEQWSLNDNYVNVMQSLFQNLNRQCIETVAVMLLQFCEEPDAFRRLLGDQMSKDWKYVLCTKIPLMSYYDWTDTTLLCNLIAYLSVADSYELLLKLLAIWGDRSAVNHTPLEQHIYISQAILLCIVKLADSEDAKPAIQGKLLSAIPVHLESPFEAVRAIGMVTIELAVSALYIRLPESDKPVLDFDYRGMGNETLEIVANLRLLVSQKQSEEVDVHERDCKKNEVLDKLESTLQEFEELQNKGREVKKSKLLHGSEMLLKFMEECGMLEENQLAITKTSTLIMDKKRKEQHESNIKKVIDELTKDRELIDSDEMDSDDDEDSGDYTRCSVPNDTPISTAKQPKYLRDLRDGLLETKDFDTFRESLKISKTLIKSQLPNDDVNLGIELINIFLSLEEKFCVKDFENIRLSALVSIVTVFPAPCAEYLCLQFSTGFGKYSVHQRMLMLDVLMASARELAQLTIETVVAKRSIAEEESKLDIVERRIESHTRRFISSRKEQPLLKINKFAAVAGSFFFPLLQNFGRTQGGLWYEPGYSSLDKDYLVLVHILHTLDVIVTCAVNCPVVVRMGAELLDVAWSLRYHCEAKVRLAVMCCIGAVVMSVPTSRLKTDLQGPLHESFLWLLDSTSTVPGKGDPDVDCRKVAAHVALLITNVFNEK